MEGNSLNNMLRSKRNNYHRLLESLKRITSHNKSNTYKTINVIPNNINNEEKEILKVNMSTNLLLKLDKANGKNDKNLHENTLKYQLNKFKISIEKKFNTSEINKKYEFPRIVSIDQSEPESILYLFYRFGNYCKYI